MILSRRQSLLIPVAGLISACSGSSAAETDGVGPNRGIVQRARRGKQTCDNSSVPLSSVETRLSNPTDFGSSCQMIEDSFEGPYFTCAPAPGKDITYGEAGQPVSVALRLVDGDCQPIPNGVVDVWACNATGFYSGYGYSPDESPPMLRAVLFGHIEPDLEQRFCRGALRTDSDGIAEFDTIYPGYYYGQPIHLHFKAHVEGRNLLTSQASFAETWNERVMALAPYNGPRLVRRNTTETGFPKMQIVERGDRLLATLDLIVPT